MAKFRQHVLIGSLPVLRPNRQGYERRKLSESSISDGHLVLRPDLFGDSNAS